MPPRRWKEENPVTRAAAHLLQQALIGGLLQNYVSTAQFRARNCAALT